MSNGWSAGDVGRPGAAECRSRRSVERDSRRAEWLDSFEHPAIVRFFANENRPPFGSSHRAHESRPLMIVFDCTGGESNPLDARLSFSLLVAENQMRRVRIVGPQRHHVDVGPEARLGAEHIDAQAPCECDQLPGSASARTPPMSSVDEASSGLPTPNSCCECARS